MNMVGYLCVFKKCVLEKFEVVLKEVWFFEGVEVIYIEILGCGGSERKKGERGDQVRKGQVKLCNKSLERESREGTAWKEGGMGRWERATPPANV